VVLGTFNLDLVNGVEGPGPINDLPQFELYVPEKKQDVPVLLGERSMSAICKFKSIKKSKLNSFP